MIFICLYLIMLVLDTAAEGSERWFCLFAGAAELFAEILIFGYALKAGGYL